MRRRRRLPAQVAADRRRVSRKTWLLRVIWRRTRDQPRYQDKRK